MKQNILKFTHHKNWRWYNKNGVQNLQKKQLVDILIKVLGKMKFERCMNALDFLTNFDISAHKPYSLA